jgi:hypothetical protein
MNRYTWEDIAGKDNVIGAIQQPSLHHYSFSRNLQSIRYTERYTTPWLVKRNGRLNYF